MIATQQIRELLDVDWFQYRLIRDAILQAESKYWLRRADDFTNALPRDGDYVGRSSDEQRSRHRARIEQIVTNCRHRSTICTATSELNELIAYEQWTCSTVHRLMCAVDDTESIEELRSVWHEARSTGVLDMDHPLHQALASHFDRAATRLKPVRSAA